MLVSTYTNSVPGNLVVDEGTVSLYKSIPIISEKQMKNQEYQQCAILRELNLSTENNEI